jgi:hypothetical protein
MITKADLNATVVLLAKKLTGYQYAIRGTASLVLQGFEMQVDDIDVLTNRETALICNDLFQEYLTQEVEYSESNKFKSYFGKLDIEGIPVEIMGEWQIKNIKGGWSEIFSAKEEERKQIKIDDQSIWVTTPETEIRCYAYMGRWNAFRKLKKQIKPVVENKQKLLF